ncbi:MAG: hypothetical protein HY866_23210, partial [Chloroflexi bacterium]|nr:hypothetical protein [Chloroflexota bacterium]
YALIGQADNARHYGQMCLEASHGDGVAPFYLGCAYEALARAEKVAGNTTQMEEYLSKGRQVAETISDPEEKQQLLEDLKSVV